MIASWCPWHCLTAEILQCFWNRSCCASFLQQPGSKAAARCAAGGLHLPKLLGTTAAHCTLLLHHRGVSGSNSDLGHGTGIQGWFANSLLELNIMDRGSLYHYWWFWGYSSEDQKGLHWKSGRDRVVEIRIFCLRTHCPCGSWLDSFPSCNMGMVASEGWNLGSDLQSLLRLLK